MNGDRAGAYRALMTRAAAGDDKACRLLLIGGWWPGDPASAIDRERVRAAALDYGYGEAVAG